MRPLSVLTITAAIAAAAASPSSAAPLSDPVEAGRYTFDRTQVLPTPALTPASPIVAAGGLREGGLSSLQVVPGTGNRRFLSVSDRGPNGQPAPASGGRTFPSPGFAPTIYELQADDDGRLSVLSRTQIRVPGPNPLRAALPGVFQGDPTTITGFRNLAALGLDDNMYLQTGDNTIGNPPPANPPGFLPTDPYGLDTEGLQRDPRDGSYWLSEEYRPSIVHLDRHGVMLERIVPIGSGAQDTDASASTVTLSSFYGGGGQPQLDELLPAEWKARRQNRGLESIALSPGGTRLYAMMQSPLDTRNNTDIDPLTAGTQDLYKTFGYGDFNGVTGGRCDGVTPGSENTTSPVSNSTNLYRNVRVVELDISDPASPTVTGEWIYRTESQSTSDTTIQGRQRISDIAWLAPGRLVVDEHDDDALAATGTSTGRKLFEIDLTAATNLITDPAYDSFAERTTRIAGVGGKSTVQPLGCYLDNGTAAELAALPAPVVAVAKSTYLDIGSAPAGVGFDLGKPEGVTMLEGVAGVAVANDNDFGFAQADDLTISPAADPTEQLRFYATRPTGAAPTVSGTAKAGRTLTCAPGAYGGTGTLVTTFTWLRGATPITGADDNRLTLTTEDVGSTISCRVAATRVSGPVRAPAATQTSAATEASRTSTRDSGHDGAAGPAADRARAGRRRRAKGPGRRHRAAGAGRRRRAAGPAGRGGATGAGRAQGRHRPAREIGSVAQGQLPADKAPGPHRGRALHRQGRRHDAPRGRSLGGADRRLGAPASRRRDAAPAPVAASRDDRHARRPRADPQPDDGPAALTAGRWCRSGGRGSAQAAAGAGSAASRRRASLPGARARSARRCGSSPTRSIAQMTIGEMSISKRPRPWRAERGKAWWLWCHDSPNVGIASQATFVDLSSTSKRRRPKKWQTELIDHVAWCRKNIRTKPAHSSVHSAPVIEKPCRTKPSTNGISRLRPTKARKLRLIQRMPLSSQRSGAYLRNSASPCVLVSQPTCAYHRPFRPEPWPTCGLCGSPSSSVWAWCLRWSATHAIAGPWTAIEPAMAQKYSTGLDAWKALWVSMRW